MINNKDSESSSTRTVPRDVGCRLGRLVDEATGQAKDPSQTIIQYGGRVRLPDKLIEILNKDFAPEVIWWQPDGECFAFDSRTVQEKILDVWFRGTKLSSFIRSLNRWGFRRVFYHALPESALAFHHPSFAKTSTPEMLKEMKMSKSSSKAPQAIAAASDKAEASPAPVPVPASVFVPIPKRAEDSTVSAPGAALSLASNLSTTTPLTSQATRNDRLTQLSELVGIANQGQLTLPTLPVSNTTASAADPDLLLRLLSEQRSRQLLADAQANQRMIQLVHLHQQQQREQQQQQDTAALRMALLALNHQNRSQN